MQSHIPLAVNGSRPDQGDHQGPTKANRHPASCSATAVSISSLTRPAVTSRLSGRSFLSNMAFKLHLVCPIWCLNTALDGHAGRSAACPQLRCSGHHGVFYVRLGSRPVIILSKWPAAGVADTALSFNSLAFGRHRRQVGQFLNVAVSGHESIPCRQKGLLGQRCVCDGPFARSIRSCGKRDSLHGRIVLDVSSYAHPLPDRRMRSMLPKGVQVVSRSSNRR